MLARLWRGIWQMAEGLERSFPVIALPPPLAGGALAEAISGPLVIANEVKQSLSYKLF